MLTRTLVIGTRKGQVAKGQTLLRVLVRRLLDEPLPLQSIDAESVLIGHNSQEGGA